MHQVTSGDLPIAFGGSHEQRRSITLERRQTRHHPTPHRPRHQNRTGDQMSTRILTVTSAKRAQSSYMGNPAFVVTFTDGTVARAQTDSSVGYEVTNEIPTSNRPARPLRVVFSNAGRIVSWSKADVD